MQSVLAKSNVVCKQGILFKFHMCHLFICECNKKSKIENKMSIINECTYEVTNDKEDNS